MFKKILTSGVLVAALAAAAPAGAQAPAAYTVTPELVAAAVKEGKVVFYASTDVLVSEKVANAFQAKYPGIKVQVERAGAERIFQRINQEYGSKIYMADVIETSDAVHFIYFKRNNWLQPAVPVDVEKYWSATEKDVDGQFAAYRAHLSVIAYNTKQVKKEDAPKSLSDLLNPKWDGKMIKAHPGYSGTIMTGTYAISQLLGWEYFEKLGKQHVMQTQSSTEPPKKLAQGERQVMADGNEYAVHRQWRDGAIDRRLQAHARDAAFVANHFLERVVVLDDDLAFGSLGIEAVDQDGFGAELVAAVDDRHFSSDIGQVQRFLDGRVAAAYHCNFLAAVEKAVAGGAGAHAFAHERRFRRQAEVLGRRAG